MPQLQKAHHAADFHLALEEYRTYSACARRTVGSDRGRFAARAGVALKAMRKAAREHNLTPATS